MPIVARALLAISVTAGALSAATANASPFTEGASAYAAERYDRAERLLRPLAERGDARAETYLGVMYMRGQGVPENYEAATLWLGRGARAGVGTAQYFLGLMYDRGLGVAQDSVLAEAWLDLAVAHADRLERRRWTPIRDAIALKLSRADLDEAQRLALEWGR